MRGISINDLPERYQRQVRAQLAPNPARISVAKPERNEQVALVQESGGTPCMVHSNRPLLIRITRNRGRTLDTDNLAGGCKQLRDAIASAFGRKGDSAEEGFTWEYVQESRNYY